MSYRNPQQVIDTQSGQHIRNMMKTVTDTAVNVIKTNQAALRKREKENVENQQRLLAEQGRYANNVDAADINNTGTDWRPALEEAKRRHAELVAKRNNDPLNFSTMDVKELSFYQTLPARIKTQSIETEAKMQSYNTAISKNVGDRGGLDKFANPEDYEQTNIEGQVGLTGGKSIGSFTFDRELGIGNAKVTSYRLDGKKIGTDANRNFDVQIVPDPTKNLQEVSQILNKSNIKENQYKRNENGTLAKEIKRVPVKDGDDYSVEVQPVDMERLMRDVRAQTDSYIESLSPQEAIRLRNNQMLQYVDEKKTKMKVGIFGSGAIDLGQVGNIVDPDKSTWIKNAQGQVIDPDLETTKIAYARLYIQEHDLGKDKEVRRINDPSPNDVKEKTPFQKAIDTLQPNIKVSAKDTWVLKGKGDNRYYELPPPKDSKNMDIGKAQTVNVFLFDESGKKIGKNILGMRSQMVTVTD